MTALLGITRPYDASYFNGMSSGHAGAGTSFDISLGGRPYMLDLIPESEGGGQGYQQKSLPFVAASAFAHARHRQHRRTVLRTPWITGGAPQTLGRTAQGNCSNDRGRVPSEHSVHASKGMDCWTPGQITLLNDTTQVTTSANDNLELVVLAGTEVYMLDGTALFSPVRGDIHSTHRNHFVLTDEHRRVTATRSGLSTPDRHVLRDHRVLESATNAVRLPPPGVAGQDRQRPTVRVRGERHQHFHVRPRVRSFRARL